MSETLTFGPQWLRALSSGNSVTSPPPSPGPKYKMAEYRYGKEEMLALFIEDLVKPVELDHFSSISREKSHFPLAFVPPTEEEQRYSLGSVNSNAVLKLMGRGAPRGAVRGSRGGLGGRGRGRGDGGFMRQSSYEDTRTESGGFRDPRRQSWEEGRRGGGGGFERGNISGRGYDPTMRGRLTSDTTWDKNEKGGQENWRSGVQHDAEDDGGGWRVSGHRYPEKTDRWRGGPKLTRSSSWRNSDSFRDERSFADEEWQVARGPRVRSFHERDDRWNNPSEPEWCKDDDFEDLDVTGTFDSSGAFRSQKKEDNKSNVTVKEEKNEEERLQANGKGEELEARDQAETRNDEHELSDEKPAQGKQTDKVSPNPANTALTSSTTKEPKPTTSTPDIVQPCLPLATAAQPEAGSPPTVKTEQKSRLMETENRESYEECESDKKDEEPNMEHFAKAAENLVMSLDDEVEKSDPDSHPPGFHNQNATTPTSQVEEIKWFYTDPQGKMQGPFTNTEMADWFNHGYFTMSLMIKRSIDEAFQPLGDLIKSWGRVPFLPGPQPPPLKGIPEQLQQQHLIAQQQQQQYQQLLQQHMMQQRFLQQQALMMQQQLHMQQHQQEQSPTTNISPQSTSTHMEIPPHMLQTTLEHQHLQQKLQQQQQLQKQQQQQQRPQALSVSSESIWTGPGATPTSPGISPGPWSPVTTSSVATGAAPTPPSPARGWDVEHGSKEKIQSLQEIQRIEEEKELAIKLENERREAALKKEEELRRRQQQEYLLQRQRAEEERRRQEEMEKIKREQEELLKKQQEEARRQQEEELRKQQQKQQQQQAARQKQLEQQKRQMEEQKMIEMRKQQQQALARLQQQQQELQRRKEIEEQKQKELQQKLQQKRQSQNASSSLWGPPPIPSTPSLTEIQQQQEKRERSAQQEKERLLQQEREQQQRNAAAAAAAGWIERNNKGTSGVKSLLEIQQEQERQQLAKKQNQQLSRSHPSPHNPLSSTVWGNNSSALSSSWASPAPSPPSTNAWGAANKTAKQPSKFVALSKEDDDDDEYDEYEDDDDDDEEESFWDEAVKEAKKAGQNKQQPKLQSQQRKQQQQQQQQQQAKPQSAQPKNKQPSNAAFPGLGNKTQSKRTSKDEENVRRIFQQQSSVSDEFARWFEKSLKALKVTSIDIPTFFAFLQEIESPYEVHDYVKSYVGDNKEAHEFARDFIEQRKKGYSHQNTQPSLPQGSVWGNVHQKSTVSQKAPQEEYVQNAQADTTTNKKKKKKKMQKVDPRILGFSVNAAERVNIGEIQTLEDA